MKDYFIREKEYLDRVREQVLPEFRDKVKSFIYSQWISERLANPLLFLPQIDKKVISNIAFVAYGYFVRRFLEQVNEVLRKAGIEFNMNDLPELTEIRDTFLHQTTEEPFIDWLFTEGFPRLEEIRSRIKVESIEELAYLVRILDYTWTLFDGLEEVDDCICALYEVPGTIERLASEKKLLEDHHERLLEQWGQLVINLRNKPKGITSLPQVFVKRIPREFSAASEVGLRTEVDREAEFRGYRTSSSLSFPIERGRTGAYCLSKAC